MTTFAFPEIRAFAAKLEARMNSCDNGEGMECATIDGSLRQYASLCCDYIDTVRRWGQSVFAGRIAFDPDVEKSLIEEGCRLNARAMAMLAFGQRNEVHCHELSHEPLQAALWELNNLLKGWVSPKLAVGPSARQGIDLSPSQVEEARRRVQSLPPLPSDWQPTDAWQQMQLKKLKRR
jgi:hypothetical protein